jgi:hypothetical protein|tara:strand:+ start:238 stop:822 length:585 start_codon:yes stop_codon:yes gene_type:complete
MKSLLFLIILTSYLFQSGCGALKYKKVSAKDFPPDPKERVQKNIEEGKGFRVMGNNALGGSGTFEFASSNPLWQATLDTISFMPLVSANYSGGIIITDWYSENNTPNESIKITVRFLTNEIRSDALDIKIFIKECEPNSNNCSINERKNDLAADLSFNILKKATLYKKNIIDKNKKENPYVMSTPSNKKKKTKK